MDAATLQARIYAGRAKAAARIGLACNQFRPLTAAAPLGNQVGTLLAAFNAADNNYRGPNKPGVALWYADLDGRLTQVGDYLVRQADGGTFFVLGQQPLLPIMVIECNRTVALLRQPATAATGAVPYGGAVFPTAVAALGTLKGDGSLNVGWPASILFGGRQEHAAELPMSVGKAGWRIMLPASVPVQINQADILLDDLGRRYSVEAAELTDLGWRINAKEAHI